MVYQNSTVPFRKNANLNEQSYELEEYNEQLVRRLIEKVTVFDDKLTVEFKSGMEMVIDIKLILNYKR